MKFSPYKNFIVCVLYLQLIRWLYWLSINVNVKDLYNNSLYTYALNDFFDKVLNLKFWSISADKNLQSRYFLCKYSTQTRQWTFNSRRCGYGRIEVRFHDKYACIFIQLHINRICDTLLTAIDWIRDPQLHFYFSFMSHEIVFVNFPKKMSLKVDSS